jgi:hypothetical protein
MFFVGGDFLFAGVIKCAPMVAQFARACKARFALCSDLFLDSINVLSQEFSPMSTPFFDCGLSVSAARKWCKSFTPF